MEQVANTLAAGNGVAVIPSRMQLTTHEAADLLGVSRPTLVRLLEAGATPFQKPGRHRRGALSDLVADQEHEQDERRVRQFPTRFRQAFGVTTARPDSSPASSRR
ncbi:excisionase family DNA-binding protein [Curtobacterium sp. MCBD17_040]|uniref:excisionase family DNA-binding protein n=1 Tax=Curtobacterium sp. MCBD17_040 TaxID=2175674 RepID=UPI000DA98EA9|nr:excisionase family DNA-binding protein [Curtobacterium sp. MCBD17_040]WIB63407.1 excisionase family DNA-binding protein [Curtobacterium sp. MCBD17_040]